MTNSVPVIFYTTSSCFYCKIAREFLKKNNIAFEERDVLVSPVYLKEMEEKSRQRGVPVFEIGNDIYVGFDRPVLANALGIRE